MSFFPGGFPSLAHPRWPTLLPTPSSPTSSSLPPQPLHLPYPRPSSHSKQTPFTPTTPAPCPLTGPQPPLSLSLEHFPPKYLHDSLSHFTSVHTSLQTQLKEQHPRPPDAPTFCPLDLTFPPQALDILRKCTFTCFYAKKIIYFYICLHKFEYQFHEEWRLFSIFFFF